MLFPELYQTKRVKEAFVVIHLWVRNAAVHWELDFTRLIQDWEMESVTNFLDLIYSVSVKGHRADHFCW